MKILVTGANGFVGRVLVRELASADVELFALDIAGEPLAGVKKFYRQDLARPFKLDEDFDFVFHLGAYNVTHVGARDAQKYQETNVQGTSNLLSACRARNFVFLSTAKVYAQTGQCLTEESPLSPAAEYERSKLAAEEVCRREFKGEKLCVFRAVNIAGPGQSPKAIIPVFFERAAAGKPIDVFAPRDTALQFIDVDDVVALFKLVIARNGVSGVFNIAGPDQIRIDELAQKVIGLCRSRSAVNYANSGSAVLSRVSADKIRKVLGWQASNRMADILRKYFAALTKPEKNKKTRVLVCGILPPPNFGHSMIHKMVMVSDFVKEFDVTFFDLRFWSYREHKKVTLLKLLKLVKYYFQFVGLMLVLRPRYVLYGISFDKMPFLKDALFCLTGRMLGGRIVLHDMGQYLKAMHDSGGAGWQRFVRFFMRRMSASIVLGENTRAVYEGFMDADRVFAVPGAVEDSAGITAPGRNTGGKVAVLYFSFLSVTKGIWTALKAVPQVVAGNPDIHFTFAGPVESPQLRSEIDAFVRREGLERFVTLAGYVEDEQTRTRYFRQSDIFIFPTHRDVFGLVLLHAMAESLPVIASREGCIPEIIEDGNGGFLIEKGNDAELAAKVLALAGDPGRRVIFGKNNRERFEKLFTRECFGQKLIAVFKELEKPA